MNRSEELALTSSAESLLNHVDWNRETKTESIVIHYQQAHMKKFLYQSLRKGNMLCRDLAEKQTTTRDTIPIPSLVPVQYELELNCTAMYLNYLGTGNVLQIIYGLRLASRLLGNVEVQIQCNDAEATKSDLLLPWVSGSFSLRANATASLPPLEDSCLPFTKAPVHYLMDDIRYELRRMAIALVGIPYPTHPAADFVLSLEREEELQVPMPTAPLIPNVELDDVAIHFRCGDIVEVKPHPGYGYARFSSLVKYISSDAQSIGILTQPFHGQNRRVDGTNATRCPMLIVAFQDYLQDRFPNATVNVRNSPNETVTLAYARFIMAKQSLAAGYSTFVFFPFMSSFGTGYLERPSFIEPSFEQHVNARFIDHQDKLSSVQLFELWKESNGQEQILDWFTGDEGGRNDFEGSR